MQPMTKRLVELAAAAVVAAVAAAQAPADPFAPPVRLSAGDKFLGEKRLYPSPVCHDVDGDGKLDVVVGDLWGALTFARRDGSGLTLAAEAKMQDEAGNDLKFHNW